MLPFTVSLIAAFALPSSGTWIAIAWWSFVAAVVYSLLTRGRKGWGWYVVSIAVATALTLVYALATRRWIRRAAPGVSTPPKKSVDLGSPATR